MQPDVQIDDGPDSQRITVPDIVDVSNTPTVPAPASDDNVAQIPKIPKSRAVLESAWLMLEHLFSERKEA
jgi:hypothetical protein